MPCGFEIEQHVASRSIKSWRRQRVHSCLQTKVIDNNTTTYCILQSLHAETTNKYKKWS